MNNAAIDSYLVFAHNAISNAINQPLLRLYLDEYGYTEAKLTQGMTLYKRANDAHQKQKKEWGEKFETIFELNEARANKTYVKYLKVARIVLAKEPEPVSALQLLGRRARSFSGWMNQARAFYTNAIRDPRILESLEEYNITRRKLVEGQELLLECEVKYNAQLNEKREAKAVIKQRDEAFDALDAWMNDFESIARIALEENPLYMDVLGIAEQA